MADKKNEKPLDGAEETEVTQPTSLLDLERRLEDGYVPDSDVRGTVRVNPNPFGDEEYVGTDPIYQNYANDVNKPLASGEGVQKEQETAHREMYDLDNVDGKVVDDYGLGGQAEQAGDPGLVRETFVLPGQEGYPDNPDKYTGPPIPRSVLENDSDSSVEAEDDSDEEEDTGPDITSLNMGASTQPPPSQ